MRKNKEDSEFKEKQNEMNSEYMYKVTAELSFTCCL